MEPFKLPIPEGLDVIENYGGVTIRRRWFSHIVWFLLPFCIVWNSFLVFWYSKVFSPDGPREMEWLFGLFPLIHVAVGIGLAYFVFCLFFNTTDIIMQADRLQITTYPLPWPGAKNIPASELASFNTETKFATHHSENGNSTSVKFIVNYVDSTNHEKPLLSGFTSERQADFIRGRLAHYYGKAS